MGSVLWGHRGACELPKSKEKTEMVGSLGFNLDYVPRSQVLEKFEQEKP